MSQMSNEEYIKTGGNNCPFCKSDEIESESQVQVDSTSAWQDVECKSCGRHWQDVYNLVGFDAKI